MSQRQVKLPVHEEEIMMGGHQVRAGSAVLCTLWLKRSSIWSIFVVKLSFVRTGF